MGPYIIERVLGEGAQAVVYLAKNRLLKRRAALKIFKQAPSSDNRIFKEARIIAALEHPNIVRIYQMERLKEIWYIATEYIDGGAISQRLRGGPLPFDEVLAFAQGITSGLAHAHALGVLHNDIKPQNLLIAHPRIQGAAEVAKLADFGLASAVGRQEFIGTPLYMAPEIWAREGASVRSDLYSLGASLYHMAVGRPPFIAPSAEMLQKAHERKRPRYPQGFPDDLRGLIEALMAKEPDQRPPDAASALEMIPSPGQHQGRAPPANLAPQATPLPREAASWALEGLKRMFETMPCLQERVEGLGETLALLPSLVLLECRQAQILGPFIGRALECQPSLSLVERLFVDARPDAPWLQRLEALKASNQASSVAHVHLERPLTPIEGESLMRVAEARGRGLCLLFSGTREVLGVLWGQLRASGRDGLARHASTGRLSAANLRRLLELLAEAADLKCFTADASRRIFELEESAPHRLELLLHNAVALARLTEQPVVTTWAVAGALAHERRLNQLKDVDPSWRQAPRSWPPGFEDEVEALPVETSAG